MAACNPIIIFTPILFFLLLFLCATKNGLQFNSILTCGHAAKRKSFRPSIWPVRLQHHRSTSAFIIIIAIIISGRSIWNWRRTKPFLCRQEETLQPTNLSHGYCLLMILKNRKVLLRGETKVVTTTVAAIVAQRPFHRMVVNISSKILRSTCMWVYYVRLGEKPTNIIEFNGEFPSFLFTVYRLAAV